MAGLKYFTKNDQNTVKSMSFYRMSDAPPDWSQNDPSQPNYIANRDMAEKLRPIYVDSVLVLDDTHESGPLNFISGEGIALTVNGNNVSINSTNSGGSIIDIPKFVQGDGIIIADVVNGTQSISVNNKYILDELIAPVLAVFQEQLEQQNIILTTLVGNDVSKSAREISNIVIEQTVPTLINDIATRNIENWVKNNAELAHIINQVETLNAIVDITTPITKYVEDKISEIGKIDTTVASVDDLGIVKFDGKTIKMNENKQLYVSKISTDDIELGEKILVLNGGNELL